MSFYVFFLRVCVLGCSAESDSLRPMDCNLPNFSVRGIFQARILKWSAISCPRGSFQPWGGTCVSNVSCTSATWGAPVIYA